MSFKFGLKLTVLCLFLCLLAVLGGVFWKGYEAQRIVVVNSFVWVKKSAEGRQVARVNTLTKEIDTVKDVEGDAQFRQHEGLAYFEDPPLETVLTRGEGAWVGHVTVHGELYLGRVGQGARRADFASEVPLRAAEIAFSEGGAAAVLDNENSRVLVFDGQELKLVSESALPEEIGSSRNLAFVGEKWVLFDGKNLVKEGQQVISLLDHDVFSEGFHLQRSAPESESVLISTPSGLFSAALNSGEVKHEVVAHGTTLKPFFTAGVWHSAWLEEGGGNVWNDINGLRSVRVPDGVQRLEPQLSFISNGDTVYLNEETTGTVWDASNGAVIAEPRNWSLEAAGARNLVEITTEPERIPKPPVATDDVFGVRAGSTVSLPVTLNDYDANSDIFSVSREGLGTLPQEFGVVAVAYGDSAIAARISPKARGEATFSYRLNDGSGMAGLESEPAKVTLRVVPDSTNTAPVWCGVAECVANWPSLELAPGEKTEIDVINGWVDPEGDEVYVASAKVLSSQTEGAPLQAVVNGARKIVLVAGMDAPSEGSVSVEVTISDTRGATTKKNLNVRFVPESTSTSFSPRTETVLVGIEKRFSLEQFLGLQINALSLVGVKVVEGAQENIRIDYDKNLMQVGVQALKPDNYILEAEFIEKRMPVYGRFKVVALKDAPDREIMTPIIAKTSFGQETVLDLEEIFSHCPSCAHGISISEVSPKDGASLRARVTATKNIRIAGQTKTGEPGAVGVIELAAEGEPVKDVNDFLASVIVVQTEEDKVFEPVVLNDRAVALIGAQIDIPVLENDVSHAGSRLELEQGALATSEGCGFAFATKSKVRFFAPAKSTECVLQYTAFNVAAPQLKDFGQIFVTVKDPGEETQFSLPPLEATVRAGEVQIVPFDYSQSEHGRSVQFERLLTLPQTVSVQISETGEAFEIAAPKNANGLDSFSFEVSDHLGRLGEGTAEIVLSAEPPSNTIIAFPDTYRFGSGGASEITVHPLQNDVTENGELTLDEVLPLAVEGSEAHEYLKSQIKNIDKKNGTLTLQSFAKPGEYSFRYRAKNDFGESDWGAITIEVAPDLLPDRPSIADTVVHGADEKQFKTGIDVIRGKTVWAFGEEKNLAVELAFPQPGFEADGSKVLGEVSKKLETVLFKTVHVDGVVEAAEGFGFVRVLGNANQQLLLKDEYRSVSVFEGETLVLNPSQILTGGRGLPPVVIKESVSSKGIAGASCVLGSENNLRYVAAKSGAPYGDHCDFSVTIGDGSANREYPFRVLINVMAKTPAPVWRTLNISLMPGESARVPLLSVLDDDVREFFKEEDLVLSNETVGYKTEVREGFLHIFASDVLQINEAESLYISHREYSESQGEIRLVAAETTRELPLAGTLKTECRASLQEGCLLKVSGLPGEQNPFPKTPLSVAEVLETTGCTELKVDIFDSVNLRVSWPADTAGVPDCKINFLLKDAQGRTGPGSATFSLLAKPQRAPEVIWRTFSEDSVGFQISSQQQVHPEISGFRVAWADREQICEAHGECVVSGLKTFTKNTFTVFAVNSEGSTAVPARVTAWAYDAPKSPELELWQPELAGEAGARVSIFLKNISPDTKSLLVSGPGAKTATFAVTGKSQKLDYEIGTNSKTDLTITPQTSQEAPPEGVFGNASSGILHVSGVHGVGAPKVTSDIKRIGLHDVRVTVLAEASGGEELFYGLAERGQACVPESKANTFDIKNLELHQEHDFLVCAAHRHAGVLFPITQAQTQTVSLEIPKPQASYLKVFGPGFQVETDLKDTPGLQLKFFDGESEADSAADLLDGREPLPTEIFVKSCSIQNTGLCSEATQLRVTDSRKKEET